MSRATAGSTCCAVLGDTRRSAPRSCSVRWPAASATAGRRTTAPPTTCCARASRASVTTRPGTRGIAIDWTAWAEHRHGQPRVHPEDDGAGRDRHAAARGRRAGRPAGAHSPEDPDGEVVVAGASAAPRRGGRARRPGRRCDGRPQRAGRPMVGEVVGWTLAGGSRSRPRSTPPSRVSSTTTASTACRCCRVPWAWRLSPRSPASLPGWQVIAVEDVEFLAPFKFYRDEPRTLDSSHSSRSEGSDLVADCRLSDAGRSPTSPSRSRPTSPAAGPAGRRSALAPATHRSGPDPAGPVVGADDDLPGLLPRARLPGARRRLAGPTGASQASFAVDLPPTTSRAAFATVMDPRLIELCFQTAGVLELGATGRMALPEAPAPDRGAARAFDATGWRSRATPRADGRASTPSSPTPGQRPDPARGLRDDRASGRDRRRVAGTSPQGGELTRPKHRLAPAVRHDPARRRIAIVNRGEPAMRLIHAVREYRQEVGRDIRTIALYTEPDRDALFVREADEAVLLGPATFTDPRRSATEQLPGLRRA